MSTEAMKLALEALEGVMDFRHDSAGMIRGGNYLQKDAVESALRRALSAQPPASPQPSGYESTTPWYTRWVSPARWAKFSPAVQKWYRPYWVDSQPPAPSVPAGWAVTYDGKRASYIYADQETAEFEAQQVGGTARAVAVYLAPPPVPSVPAVSWGVIDHMRFASTTAPPPVRERLTDEQIDAAIAAWFCEYQEQSFRSRMRAAIERALIVGE